MTVAHDRVEDGSLTRRSLATAVEAAVLAADAAGFLQAGTQGLGSPMKTDPQVILVHIRLNYRHPRRVRKSLCPEEGQVHGLLVVLQRPRDRANLPNCLGF